MIIHNSFVELFGSKDILQQEVDSLKEELDKLQCPLVLCHNDLLLGNIIYNEDNGEWVWPSEGILIGGKVHKFVQN